MCGIIGYIGDKEAQPILIQGLKRLEYRGYDSAGIAVIDKGKIDVFKCKGRIANLEEKIKFSKIHGNVGIAHTRWATHGEPSDINAHPHLNQKGNIAVVHNGIIENYLELRKKLAEKGYTFLSETDTEVIPSLIDYYYNGDLKEAVLTALKELKGSFALAIMSKDNPDEIIAVRRDSPLVIGIGKGENFIASDITAVINWTKDVIIIENSEVAVVKKDSLQLMDFDGNLIEREPFEVTWNVGESQKGGYEHFMLKEISEQPKALKDTISPRIDESGNIKLDEFPTNFDNVNKIYVIACGTAYHAGLVGKNLIEKYAKIPVSVDIASEFRYNNPFIDKNTFMIIISQSGETADTLAALRLGRKKGAKILSICNVVGSSIPRESDYCVYTWAGPEIAVASTKAYTTQVAVLAMISLYIGKLRKTISDDEYTKVLNEIKSFPQKAESVLKMESEIESISSYIVNQKDVFYIGRSIDYYVAMEGSLKLKEISYIHSEAIAAGELKHGTLALVEDGVPVIALATQNRLFDKTLSNIKEVKARGGYVIAIAKKGNKEIEKEADVVLYIPEIIDELTAPLSGILLQLLAYYAAKKKGCDIDKPRNLAKSVTVE